MVNLKVSKSLFCLIGKLLMSLVILIDSIQVSLATEQSKVSSFHGIPAPQPQAGSMFLFPERIKQSSRGFINAERGFIFVPLNRADKNSDVIAVEVYRFKRSKVAKPNTPPIFYLPGGPGYEGLQGILERNPNYYQTRIEPHLDISDFIVVSQRGIGPSKPTTMIETTLPPKPLDQSIDNNSRIKEMKQVLEKERSAWLRLGVDLSGYNVIEAGEDINDIRKAFGYSKITLWGGSFGSHWAMAMMRLHPEVVERAVLWGMEGPGHTYDHPGHIWNVYKRVAKEAEQSTQLKPYIPAGGLVNAVESIVKRIDQKSITVTVTDPATKKSHDVIIDSNVIRNLTQGYSEDGLKAWPADIITMYNGDFRGAAEYLLKRHKSHNKRFSTASFYMLDCGSGISEDLLKAYREDAANNFVQHRNWTYENGCPIWQSDLGDEFRQNFISQIPTVIVQGSWDLYTPFENAIELRPYFKKAKFVTVQGGPHWAVGSAREHSVAFKKGIKEFVASGSVEHIPEFIEMPSVRWVLPENGFANEPIGRGANRK